MRTEQRFWGAFTVDDSPAVGEDGETFDEVLAADAALDDVALLREAKAMKLRSLGESITRRVVIEEAVDAQPQA